MKRSLVGCIAAIILTVAAAPAAAATLSGPTQLRVLQKVTYRATGLPRGDYALIIQRDSYGTRIFEGTPEALTGALARRLHERRAA